MAASEAGSKVGSKARSVVLIADDQPEVLQLLAEKLRGRGKEVLAFTTGALLVQHLRQSADAIELVVLDLDFGAGEQDGIVTLQQIKQDHPDTPVTILTGKGNVDAAVDAVQQGAADFIEKDLFVEDKLELSMEKVERMLQVLRENAQLRALNQTLDRENTIYRSELSMRYRIISDSPKIHSLLHQVEQIASVPRPVLIRGERGTGKELIAAALHYGSDRASAPFVKLNCAAVSESLLEAELFGHEKGAFTGANEARLGRFEMADGGTLFLDEIGNTSLEFQQNLLRVIEYPEFERIGGSRTIRVDVRVVAATNAELEEAIKQGSFRADLYDRLRFSELSIPPLRDRREDIRPLVHFFAAEMTREVASIPARGFSPAALTALETYRWPGNVRELKFAVERALCMATSETVEPADLPPEIADGRVAPAQGSTTSFDDQLDGLEQGILRRALDEADGSQKSAAATLGLKYDRFRHLLRKHGLTGH
jgi:DNA-binding NtrC family response regulator